MKREDPLYLAVGEKIRAARLQKGVSQARLSKATGISRVSVAMYELGRSAVPIAKLYRIAAFLGCEATDFIPPRPNQQPPSDPKSDEFHALLIKRLGGL